MPLTWSDDFTTDNFTNGTAIYTLLTGTEGTTFTVAPHDLAIPGGGACLWIDERSPQSYATSPTFPLLATLTVTNLSQRPYVGAPAFLDVTSGKWLLLGGPFAPVTNGFGIYLADASGGPGAGNYLIGAASAWTPPATPFTISLSCDAAGNVSVTDGTTIVSGTVPIAALQDIDLQGVFPGALGYGLDPTLAINVPQDFSFWTYGPQSTTPTITGLAANVGHPAGGETVTITGTLFTGTMAVTFGGVPATSFMVVDDHHITAVAPAGTATTRVDVVVTNASGSSTPGATSKYTYAGHIASWIDDFTSNNFPPGTDDYTVLVGGGFTVSPNDLNISFGSELSWMDQRTYQVIPFDTTITVVDGAFASLEFGLADYTGTTVAVYARYTSTGSSGTMTLFAVDPTDGLVSGTPTSHPVPSFTSPYKFHLNVTTSLISVFDETATPVLITTLVPPTNLNAAINGTICSPFVTVVNT